MFVMPCFWRRLLETFAVNIIISAPFGILTEIGKIPRSYMVTLLIMGACVLASIIINSYMLRSYYCFVKNRFDYFTVNLLAYIIFFGAGALLYKFCSAGYLSWVFYTVPFYMFRLFECFSIPVQYSVLLTHLLNVVVIFAAPLEMYRVMDVMRTISPNMEEYELDKKTDQQDNAELKETTELKENVEQKECVEQKPKRKVKSKSGQKTGTRPKSKIKTKNKKKNKKRKK